MRVFQNRLSVDTREFETQTAFTGGEFRLELFNKFHFDWNVDVAFVVSIAQKFAYSRTSDLTIIPSKFVHIHSDEFAGELSVHVARICERVSDGFVPVRETIVDALANDFADITPHWWRDIFAHHVSA